MFWSNKNKKSDKQKKPSKNGLQGDSGVHHQSSKSQRIRQEALANARTARAEIGEEALDKIAAMMTKKQQSEIERAKQKIAEADAHRVLDEIMLMMDDKDK